MMRAFQYMLIVTVLFAAPLQAQPGSTESHLSLRVFPDGRVEFNDVNIVPDFGISIPDAILKAQARPPTATYVADREVWFSFEDLGLLVKRKNDARDAHVRIVLPAVLVEPFKKIQFKGELKLENENFDLSLGEKLTRKHFLDIFKNASYNGAITQNEESIILDFEDTEIYIIFDSAGRLHHIIVSLRVKK